VEGKEVRVTMVIYLMFVTVMASLYLSVSVQLPPQEGQLVSPADTDEHVRRETEAREMPLEAFTFLGSLDEEDERVLFDIEDGRELTEEWKTRKLQRTDRRGRKGPRGRHRYSRRPYGRPQGPRGRRYRAPYGPPRGRPYGPPPRYYDWYYPFAWY